MINYYGLYFYVWIKCPVIFNVPTYYKKAELFVIYAMVNFI